MQISLYREAKTEEVSSDAFPESSKRVEGKSSKRVHGEVVTKKMNPMAQASEIH